MLLGSGDLSLPGENRMVSSTITHLDTLPSGQPRQHVGAQHVDGTAMGHGTHAGAYAVAPDDTCTAVSVPEAYAYCQRIARSIARTFYYGSLFLPPAKRRAAWALYAFCRTADDIADEPNVFPDPVRELAHWRAGLLDTYAGKPRGPVMTAWADMLVRYPVPIQPALDLLDGVAMDIQGTTYATFEDLRLYCYRVAGTVGLLMAPVLGYADDAALESAVDLGIAMQLTNILRDIGEDSAIGRVYLPAEEMEHFGYSPHDLCHGIVNAPFRALLDFQIARTEQYYQRGIQGIALLSPEARLAIALSSTLYRAILGRILRNQYDVFTRRAHISLAGKLATLPGVWLRLRTTGL